MKLAIRTDEAAGVVRAYFSSLRLARKVPGAFEAWVETLSGALATAIRETTGATVAGFRAFRPHDKN